jgi:drug/metabolite transporter (DMT)-like permease
VKPVDVLLLVCLAAIWGSSFIFMRVLSPVFGPIVVAMMRVLVAGVLLVVLYAMIRVHLQWRTNLRHYLIVGVLNSAAPFLLYSYAALHVSAAIMSVVNSLTPLWAAVFAAIILKERFTLRKGAGLVLGIAGVAVITLFDAVAGRVAGEGSDPVAFLPVLACALATACYGLSGSYVRRWAPEVPSHAMTAASMLCAAGVLLPVTAAASSTPLRGIPANAWLLAIAFSILCSGVAYLIYFRLLRNSGVTRTLSVTLLIPVFAFLWGFLFLGERIGLEAVTGGVLVVCGTLLIVRDRRVRSLPDARVG